MSSQSPYRTPESSQGQNQPQTDTSSNEPLHPHEPSLHTDDSTSDHQTRDKAPFVQIPSTTPSVTRKQPLLSVLARSPLRWGIILVGILLAIGGILLISNVALPGTPYQSDQGKALFFGTFTPQSSGPLTTYDVFGLGDKQNNY